MTGLTFAELAHMPYVEQPDSIEGVTEEWFESQKELIESRIKLYELNASMPQAARRWETDKLRKLIERLRKFTNEVLIERKRQKTAVNPQTPAETEKDSITDLYERQRDYDEYVDRLLELKKKDEQIARQTEFLRKSPKNKAGIV